MRIWILLATALGLGFIDAAFGQRELMVNGGFELVNAGEWQISTNSPGAGILSGPQAATGMNYLSMGNVGGANQVVYQVVKFPTNLISAVWSFNYAVVTSDASGIHDILSAYLLDTNRNVLISLGSTSNLSPTQGYN